MIDYLRHMAIFSSVAEKGSFSAAAQSLGIAPSRVSEAVSKLENYVDATLFHRTTRKVTLTSEGRTLFAFTSTMVEDAQLGMESLKTSKSTPSGTLNISVPSYLTCSPTLDVIAAFGERYRDVQIALSFSDAHVDPIQDGFDLCIRAGKPETPGLAMQKLGDLERAIIVGRDYLARQTAPEHPKDLETWDWITYRYKKRNYKLAANNGLRAHLAIDAQSKFQVDNFEGLQFLAKRNLGVAVLPLDICSAGIADGSLVRLFGDWRLSRVQHFAVWSEKARRGSLVSLFVQFLSDTLATT